MIYIWIDEGHGNGPVVAFGRDAAPHEKTGSCSTNTLVFGSDASKYEVYGSMLLLKVVNGDIEKQLAYEHIIEVIDRQCSSKNQMNFQYKLSEDQPLHNYVADTESIQAIQNDCLAKLVLGASLEDSLPVPNSAWKTDDVDEEGEPLCVTFNIGQFLEFTQAYLMRASGNFGVKEYHKSIVRSLLKDPKVGAIELENYTCDNDWLV